VHPLSGFRGPAQVELTCFTLTNSRLQIFWRWSDDEFSSGNSWAVVSDSQPFLIGRSGTQSYRLPYPNNDDRRRGSCQCKCYALWGVPWVLFLYSKTMVLTHYWMIATNPSSSLSMIWASLNDLLFIEKLDWERVKKLGRKFLQLQLEGAWTSRYLIGE
jgi:hypothetical protein